MLTVVPKKADHLPESFRTNATVFYKQKWNCFAVITEDGYIAVTREFSNCLNRFYNQNMVLSIRL